MFIKILVAHCLHVILFGFTLSQAYSCNTNYDCSLNGLCQNGKCKCDKPWSGTRCGKLTYKMNQKLSSSNLYPLNATGAPKIGPCVTPSNSCTALNTWNGPIVQVDSTFYMFNPLYKRGSLLQTQDMMLGSAENITGPYTWKSMNKNFGSNPASVKYLDPETKKIKYSLWVGGLIYVSDSITGPFEIIGKGPGSNPSHVHHNNIWYAVTQSTNEILTSNNLGDSWTKFSSIDAKIDHGVQEDPFMWIDHRGNWHIINHAYATDEFQNCGNSTLSAHIFSKDGKDWSLLQNPNVEPYSHSVHYEDGTIHTYTTLERPNCHFDENGQMTHINLAADLQSQNNGCENYQTCPAKHSGKCACTNCKYADHAGTIIIALDV
jgi:hypothetical protein